MSKVNPDTVAEINAALTCRLRASEDIREAIDLGTVELHYDAFGVKATDELIDSWVLQLADQYLSEWKRNRRRDSFS